MNTSIKSALVFTATLAAISTGTASAATASLEPGEWKTTIQTDMSNANIPGLPVGIKLPAKPAMNYTWCYKPEPGKDMGQTLADNANRNSQGQKCNMLENKSSGNNVHYKMHCTGPQGDANITGDFSVNGKKYNGTTQLQMNSPMGAMQLSSTMTGEYVGPCKAGAPNVKVQK